MTTAEYIYRALLWLYPAQHRKDYGPSMLQHARDLNLAAQQHGRYHVAVLWLRLMSDAIVNAFIEHWQVIVTAKGVYKPVPWPSVLMAAVPGLWIALSRRHVDLFAPLLLILGGGYILLIILGLPAMWWRRRQFPLWGLLFVGALTWFVPYKVEMELLSQMRLPNIVGWELASLALLADSLLLVVVGSLAARQHGVLALLFVVGGYTYLFLDNDYLFGYPSRNWPGLSLYLITMSLLYLVLIPIALLRAKTRLGRAMALFGPLLLFLLLRLIVPILATGQSFAVLRPGDIWMSLNILLTLILAWHLYSFIGGVSHKTEVDNHMPSPEIISNNQ